MERRWIATVALLALPLAGLGLLVARPDLDLTWEHHPSHFWLILLTAGVSVVLAYVTSEAASRHADARIFLVSLAFVVSAGFLGLHALATPQALLPEANTGFVIATPVGLVLAGALAAASVSPIAGPRGAAILRRRRLIQVGVAALLAAWGIVSLLRLPPLRGPMPLEELSGPLTAVSIGAAALYAYAAARYVGIFRRRRSTLALAMVVALVLLAEAILAVAFSRAWHLSWWEWHVLMAAAFATIALATRSEYRRTGSLVGALRPIYLDATLAHIDRWHGRAMADLAALETRGEPTDRLLTDLRRDGASADEVQLLVSAAREMRRLDELFRPYLPQHLADRLVAEPEAIQLGGQERVVSVLFADLHGFTTFAESRAPTTVIAVLNAYWAIVVPLIDARGGSVEQFAGDGVLVLFNAVAEQPDHPTRAGRCALEVLTTTDALAAQEGWPRFRIGVNTGPAVVGNVGAAGRRSFATIGNTTNLASRLMTAASAGQAVVGPETRRALDQHGGFQLAPLGPLKLKGIQEPVEAWTLT